MNDIGKKIVNKLIELHGSDKFKIAFLPYKRSMWNSMSSVYEVCKERGIDAHVYPIPYYRMTADGEVAYQDTDFDMFEDAEDIQTLKDPDYIAIHYYFDDCNRVTNMLPEFYTQALKDRYKCKIIFLPYGISFDVHVTNILYSGFIGMDYIFTDKIDPDFIEMWKEQGIDFTDRIFAYGSAKLDVARSLTKEIPEEWRDKIGDRPVTLILNSLIPFLDEPHKKILDYLCMTLREISRNHVVIFRPHPLMLTTIQSMAPHMEGYYAFLLTELRALGVIVDESEYLERALKAADYLISDPSSVVNMWQETKKDYEVMT